MRGFFRTIFFLPKPGIYPYFLHGLTCNWNFIPVKKDVLFLEESRKVVYHCHKDSSSMLSFFSLDYFNHFLLVDTLALDLNFAQMDGGSTFFLQYNEDLCRLYSSQATQFVLGNLTENMKTFCILFGSYTRKTFTLTEVG